jgi:putative DNA primase/helicase
MTVSDNNQTIVQFLVSLAMKLLEFFLAPEGEAYATFQIGDYQDTAPIDSREFSHWLEDIYYEQTKEMISFSDMRKVVRELSFFARKMGAKMSLYTRYAYINGCIYVDLGNKKREQIEITPDGWHLIAVKKSPIKFVRKKGMAPLVKPERGGSLNDLRSFFRLKSEADFVMMVGWVVGVMNPKGPFPILIFQGPQGSSKTTSCRFLQSIIDPSLGGVASMPQGERNMAIAASNSYLLVFDNKSGIRPEVSDVLCRIATGCSYRQRKLFSDNDEITILLKNPILMNGITDIVTRHDLADRAIVIQIKSPSEAERIDEEELEKRWDEKNPYFLGCFYDALAVALSNKGKVKTDWLPRMADHAKFVVEAESALPFEEIAYLEAVKLLSERNIDAAIENDLVAIAVLKMIDREPNHEWSGTAEELRQKLNSQTDEQIQKQKEWPIIANKLSNRLKRCESPLREKGVEIEFKHSGNRTITIRRVDESIAQTVPEDNLPPVIDGPQCTPEEIEASLQEAVEEVLSADAGAIETDSGDNTLIDGEI